MTSTPLPERATGVSNDASPVWNAASNGWNVCCAST